MLEDLKQEVCEIAQLAQRSGLCKHKSGNFSARDPLTGLIVITPTGVDRERLKPSDMIVMNQKREIIENLSSLKPTSEFLTHMMIYERKEDTKAIVHTHSLYATTIAVLNRAIPALVYEMSTLGVTKGRIPIAPYGRPGSRMLAENIREACMESETFLLEKHGVIAYDKNSTYEAYLKAAYVEELAQIYFHVLLADKEHSIKPFDQAELERWSYPDEISSGSN